MNPLVKKQTNLTYSQVIAKCLRINMKAVSGEITKLCAAQNVMRVCRDNRVACKLFDDEMWPIRPYTRSLDKE